MATKSTKKKPRKLTKLRIDRVSLVDVPAVQGSQFIIAKRHEETAAPEAPPETSTEAATETTATATTVPEFSDSKTAMDFAVEVFKSSQDFNKSTIASCVDISKQLAEAAQLQAQLAEKLETVVSAVQELVKRSEENTSTTSEQAAGLTEAAEKLSAILSDTNQAISAWREQSDVEKGKTMGGENLPASAFAYVPDPDKPSTWKLRIDDAHHVGGAVAALGAGFRGKKVSIPSKDLAAVKAKVRAAWKKYHSDEEMPEVLKKTSRFDGVLEELNAFGSQVRGLRSELDHARGKLSDRNGDNEDE